MSLRRDVAPATAVLVKVSHLVVVQVEAHAQILRSQYAMQVGHRCELLGSQSAIEGVESLDASIFALDVSFHEVDVRCQIGKQRTGKGSAQHRDTDVWILLCQRVDHGNHHGHIAQCRKPNDEDMLFLHYAIVMT